MSIKILILKQCSYVWVLLLLDTIPRTSVVAIFPTHLLCLLLFVSLHWDCCALIEFSLLIVWRCSSPLLDWTVNRAHQRANHQCYSAQLCTLGPVWLWKGGVHTTFTSSRRDGCWKRVSCVRVDITFKCGSCETFHVERVRLPFYRCMFNLHKHILSVKFKNTQHQMLQDSEQLDHENETMCGEKAEIMWRLLR